MTAQAVSEKRYFLIGKIIYEAEFVQGERILYKKPGTERPIREYENERAAKEAYIKLLEELGAIPNYRPPLAVAAF